MKKILVAGCSFARGHGLEQNINDPKLWINQIINKKFFNYQIDNISLTGCDNHWIFIEAIHALTLKDYDVAFISWTELARQTSEIGLELYSTHTMFKDIAVNINPGITVTGSWLEETGNRLRRYYNDHWAILNLIKYVNVLYQLQIKIKRKRLYFINALMPLPDQYFVRKDFTYPSELSSFERDMFQVETRDDAEVKLLYDMVHNQYDLYGGIHSECWLNLYESLHNLQVDTVSDTDMHPGYKSQDLYTQFLLARLNETM